MREPLEQRLDEWVDRHAADTGDPSAFLGAVARVRRRRRAMGVGTLTGVLACAAVFVIVLNTPAPSPSGASPGPEMAHHDVPQARPGPGDAWTLASLSRRMTDADLSPGGDLVPGGWSMGWASRSPL